VHPGLRLMRLQVAPITTRGRVIRAALISGIIISYDLNHPLLFTVAGVYFTGALLCLFYSYLFHPAQTFYDAAVGAAVVRQNADVDTTAPIKIFAGLFVLALVLNLVALVLLDRQYTTFELQRELSQIERFHSVSVSEVDDDTLYIEAWSVNTCDPCSTAFAQLAYETVNTDYPVIEMVIYQQIDQTPFSRTLDSLTGSREEWRTIAADYRYERGVELAEAEQNVSAAMDVFTEIIAFAPTYAPAYGSRGLLYVQMGQTQQAIDDLRRYELLAGDSANLEVLRVLYDLENR
jgi:hypothetical protein